MTYATIIKVEDSVKEKKELEKIILCDVQIKIYPNLEKSFLKPIARFECEPLMGKRNLYHNTSIKTSILKGDAKTKGFNKTKKKR